jgi:hypothetical protein
MKSLRELLAGLDLPVVRPAAAAAYHLPAAHLLGAELPQGHLHVWSGPPGVGKTAFLLGLLHAGARQGRTTLLATYDLSAASLTLRLLAMEAGVPLDALDRRPLAPDVAEAAARARARLASLPFHVLEARGLSTASLEDRLVRSPVRFDVLGVDTVESVVRSGAAVVATSRPAPGAARPTTVRTTDADRVGWIAPLDDRGAAEASLLANRHGGLASCRLRLDGPSARFVEEAEPIVDEGGPASPRPPPPPPVA